MKRYFGLVSYAAVLLTSSSGHTLDFQIPSAVVRVLMVDVSLVAAAVREKAL